VHDLAEVDVRADRMGEQGMKRLAMMVIHSRPFLRNRRNCAQKSTTVPMASLT
jgi:hypothetical protein